MLKAVVVAIWSCVASLGSVYATIAYRSMVSRESASDNRPLTVEARKTREINVPKIADGIIKGYVVVSFVFIVDQAVSRNTRIPPDAFVVEEAFRLIYDDDSIEFARAKKLDLKQLTDAIRARVNARLGSAVIVDVALQELQFIASADLKHKM